MATGRTTPRLGLAALLAAGLARTLAAQQGACLDRIVAVNVLTPSGHTATGLTEKDFQAEYQHQAVQVVSAKLETHPRRVVLVLDASASMTTTPNWHLAVAAAEGMIINAPADTSFALLTFATHVETTTGFGEGAAAVAKQLSTLGAKNWSKYHGPPRKTALLDALVEGLDLLQPPALGDVVFAITDGEDTASRNQLPEVQGRFLSESVRLFCFFTIPTAVATWPQVPDSIQPVAFATLAHATGGGVAWVDLSSWQTPNTDVSGVLPRIVPLLREIADFYRLEFRLPRAVKKESTWKLRVMEDSGKRNSRLQVIYPEKLSPCP